MNKTQLVSLMKMVQLI